MRQQLILAFLMLHLSLLACPRAQEPDAGATTDLVADDRAAADTMVADGAGQDLQQIPDAGSSDRTDAALPACEIDDGHEPNNQASQAAAISVPGQTSGLIACDGWDWFSFSAPAGKGLTIDLVFDSAAVNLDLYLARADDADSSIRYSAGLNPSEWVAYPYFEQDTDLLIKVKNNNDDQRLAEAYSLDVTFHEGGHCDDDDFEPDDSVETAHLIDSRYTSGFLCHDNADFHAFTVAGAGPGAQVIVKRDDIPLTLELYGDAGALLPSVLDQDDAQESSILTFESEIGVTYVLKLSNPGAAHPYDRADYRIEVIVPPPLNDTCAQAVTLSSGSSVQGSTERADNSIEFQDNSCVTWGMSGPDVAYTVNIPADQYLLATLSSAADLGFYLLEDCVSRCCWGGVEAQTGGVDEVLIYHNVSGADQSLYLIVDSAVGPTTSGTFELSVEVAASVAGGEPIEERSTCLADVPVTDAG